MASGACSVRIDVHEPKRVQKTRRGEWVDPGNQKEECC